MKKILSFLAAGVLGLGLIGCSGDLHDAELIDLTGYGIRCSGKESDWNADNDILLTDNGDGTYSVSFTAGNTTAAFAVLKCGDASWNTAYRLAQPKAQGDKANVFESGTMEQKVYLGQSADCCTIPSASEGDKVTLLITPSYTYLNIKVTVTAGVGGDSKSVAVPYYLDGYYILGSEKIGGNANWSAAVDTLISGAKRNTVTGVLTYTYKFTAGAEEVDFGIGTSGWATKYTGATFAVGKDTDYVETTKGAEKNNKITGLKVGSPYCIYIQTTPEEKVSYKVELVCNVTLKILVKGISDVGKIAVVGGSWNWDAGWTSAWGGDKAYTDLKYAEVEDDGTAEITIFENKVLNPGEKVSYEACGYWGKPDDNGDIAKADVDGEIKVGGANFPVEFTAKAGTFVCTVDLSADKATTAFAE